MSAEVPVPLVGEARFAWIDHSLDHLPREVGVPLVPAYERAFDQMLAEHVAREVAKLRPCRVRVRLVRTISGTPWKWRASCRCGWRALSWQWLRENRTGALVMALQHVGIAGQTGYDD